MGTLEGQYVAYGLTYAWAPIPSLTIEPSLLKATRTMELPNLTTSRADLLQASEQSGSIEASLGVRYHTKLGLSVFLAGGLQPTVEHPSATMTATDSGIDFGSDSSARSLFSMGSGGIRVGVGYTFSPGYCPVRIALVKWDAPTPSHRADADIW